MTTKVRLRNPNRQIVFRETPNYPKRFLKHRENHLRHFWRIWKHLVIGSPCKSRSVMQHLIDLSWHHVLHMWQTDTFVLGLVLSCSHLQTDLQTHRMWVTSLWEPEVMVIAMKTNSIQKDCWFYWQRWNKRSRSSNRANLIEVPLQSNDELTMNEEVFY